VSRRLSCGTIRRYILILSYQSLCRTSSVLLALGSFLLSFSSSISLCLNYVFASCLAVLSVNSRSIIACRERGFKCLDESLETLVLLFSFFYTHIFFKYVILSLLRVCEGEKFRRYFKVDVQSSFSIWIVFSPLSFLFWHSANGRNLSFACSPLRRCLLEKHSVTHRDPVSY